MISYQRFNFVLAVSYDLFPVSVVGHYDAVFEKEAPASWRHFSLPLLYHHLIYPINEMTAYESYMEMCSIRFQNILSPLLTQPFSLCHYRNHFYPRFNLHFLFSPKSVTELGNWEFDLLSIMHTHCCLINSCSSVHNHCCFLILQVRTKAPICRNCKIL